MLRSIVVSSVIIVSLMAVSVQAAPLSVRIDDFDFTFDTAYDAVYAYNGAREDTLSVNTDGNEVGSYRYLDCAGSGAPDILGNLPGFYPVWASSAPMIFGGDLELDLEFVANDGPYLSPGGDAMEVSLVGYQGHLKITGIIGTPLPVGVPMTLLEIEFHSTSLLARDNCDTIDLIEALGTVTTLLGEDVRGQDIEGVTFMKFFAVDESVDIFPRPGERYDPLGNDFMPDDFVIGRVSGEAGDGIALIPEPATMALLGLGGIGVLLRRRRR